MGSGTTSRGLGKWAELERIGRRSSVLIRCLEEGTIGLFGVSTANTAAMRDASHVGLRTVGCVESMDATADARHRPLNGSTMA